MTSTPAVAVQSLDNTGRDEETTEASRKEPSAQTSHESAHALLVLESESTTAATSATCATFPRSASWAGAMTYPRNLSALTVIHLPDGTWSVTAQSAKHNGTAVGKSLHTAFSQATNRDDYSVSRMVGTLKQLLVLMETDG